jgi:hypothetical protein
MPPKAKEVTELQVFTLDNMNPALLPELATFKKIQLQVNKENPFTVIIDTASRDLAKKYRTARKTARTDLEKQDKLISAKFNDAKTKVKGYISELITVTHAGEIEQQNEIDRDEAVVEEKRQEKARLEQARIDNIKNELSNYVAQWKTAFNMMNFETMHDVILRFVDSYTDYDLAVLEEFESLFPDKVIELKQYVQSKTDVLNANEVARVEKIKMAEEAAAFAKLKAEFEAEQKRIANENLKISQENERKALVITLAQEKLDADKKLKEDQEAKKLAEAEAITVAKSKKEIASIPVVDAEILVPEIETTNICNQIGIETWDSIIEDFKLSGQNSYSKFLVDNYNVPTKL